MNLNATTELVSIGSFSVMESTTVLINLTSLIAARQTQVASKFQDQVCVGKNLSFSLQQSIGISLRIYRHLHRLIACVRSNSRLPRRWRRNANLSPAIMSAPHISLQPRSMCWQESALWQFQRLHQRRRRVGLAVQEFVVFRTRLRDSKLPGNCIVSPTSYMRIQ